MLPLLVYYYNARTRQSEAPGRYAAAFCYLSLPVGYVATAKIRTRAESVFASHHTASVQLVRARDYTLKVVAGVERCYLLPRSSQF